MSMVEDNVDLGFIARLLQKNNDEFRGLRKEVADVRRLCVQAYDYMRRSDRHHSELRDDLELMVKMEIGGAMTHLHTILDGTLSRIEEKIDGLSSRVLAVETKL